MFHPVRSLAPLRTARNAPAWCRAMEPRPEIPPTIAAGSRRSGAPAKKEACRRGGHIPPESVAPFPKVGTWLAMDRAPAAEPVHAAEIVPRADIPRRAVHWKDSRRVQPPPVVQPCARHVPHLRRGVFPPDTRRRDRQFHSPRVYETRRSTLPIVAAFERCAPPEPIAAGGFHSDRARHPSDRID